MYFPKVKVRLFATFLLLSLIPILFICFLFYGEAQEAVFEQYKTSTEGHMKLADVRLSYFLRTMQQEVNDLAENKLLRQEEPDKSAILALFIQFARMHEMIGNVHLLRNDHSLLSLHPEKGWEPQDMPISFSRESFELHTSKLWLLSRKDELGNPNSIYIAQKVKHVSGKSESLLLVEIRLDKLGRWIRTNYSPEQNDMMVISPTGNIFIHTIGEFIGRHIQELPDYDGISRTLQNEKEKGVFTFRKDGETIYAFYFVSPISGNGYFEWIGGKGITQRLDRLKLILLFTICLVVGFSAYVALRLSLWIGKPIYTLVSATDSLLQGDFSIRVPIQGMEEITILEKKFNEMAGQMHTLIVRERKYMQESLDQIVRNFYLAVEMKDPYTAGHTERVTEYALILYDHLDEISRSQFSRDDLRYASLMHDIGKVAIPDHVLLKAGKLTDEEYEHMKQHSTIGANIVEQIESLAHVSQGVRHHHERWDGRGYPDHLKGEEISLIGRIIAVADTFDAMTTTRSYRKAMTFQEAYDEIVRCSSTQFDPYIVSVFQKAFYACVLHEDSLSHLSGTEREIAASVVDQRE
ncbi:HD domain-containing protein [Brevibacillus choshinensis]|uniref:HD domain-containing phosphohydrolase n=1 Tax=Brevibacillus choshinensis TaxID=54911 RepID=UPI002E1A7FE8|nr:HD domain-containing protein [Brevibacillus choshinensis]